MHDRFSNKFYKAGKYLNPYGSNTSSFPDHTGIETQQRGSEDINLNKPIKQNSKVKPDSKRQVNLSVVNIT